ncbi:MAG TPA: hypothetical protein DCP28_06700 [Cytophagales bacterium]|nr:hypothetical protein [Cytophagales bacterium]
MKLQDGDLFHVYNRGNNSQKIFFERANYLYFLRKVGSELIPFADILCYCLMPNHFHFLLRPKNGVDEEYHPLSFAIGNLISSYSQAMNRRYHRSGSFFQQGTKAKLLTKDGYYAYTCFQYIHWNPVAARIVQELHQWPYSSYCDYAGLRNGKLPSKEWAFRLLDVTSDPAQFIEDSEGFRDWSFDLSRIY